MNLKYTETGTVINGETFGDNTVSMLLYNSIDLKDDPNTISSLRFIHEMNYYNQLGKHIVIKINSPGGSVQGGFGIMEAIEDNQADTYIVGIAGSMAGVISQTGKRRFANRRAALMAHAPQSKSRKASKGLINIVRDILKTDLTEKSSLDEAKIDEIMNGKEEIFFSANEMFENGLVDQIIESGKMLDTQIVNLSSEEMYTAYDSLLNNKKPIQMENLMKHLGLENKSENDVINMVKGLELKAAKNDELETKVTDLTNEVNTLKEVAVDQLKAKAETLIDNAVEAGKLQKDSKDKWIELAITNFDLTKETLGSLTVTKKKTTTITNIIDQSANSDKDYEWMAINDPQGLINLAQDNPEKFEQLSKEFNHKQRTVN